MEPAATPQQYYQESSLPYLPLSPLYPATMDYSYLANNYPLYSPLPSPSPLLPSGQMFFPPSTLPPSSPLPSPLPPTTSCDYCHVCGPPSPILPPTPMSPPYYMAPPLPYTIAPYSACAPLPHPAPMHLSTSRPPTYTQARAPQAPAYPAPQAGAPQVSQLRAPQPRGPAISVFNSPFKRFTQYRGTPR